MINIQPRSNKPTKAKNIISNTSEFRTHRQLHPPSPLSFPLPRTLSLPSCILLPPLTQHINNSAPPFLQAILLYNPGVPLLDVVLVEPVHNPRELELVVHGVLFVVFEGGGDGVEGEGEGVGGCARDRFFTGVERTHWILEIK